MTDNLQPPTFLSLQGNISDNWRRWKQRFTIYVTASKLNTEEIKAATFLHVVGEDALELYNTFTWEADGDQHNMEKIMEKFEAYCNPKKNVTWERHVFNTRAQKSGETIDEYVTDLRSKARTCEFGDLMDSLIRDRIVCGIEDDATRKQLLKEKDLSLQKAIDIC